jgi:hypothetical protein
VIWRRKYAEHRSSEESVDRISEYVALAVAIHGLAVVIVNMTPTPKDNERLSDVARMAVKAYRAIEIMAGLVSKRAKQ